VHVGIGWTFLVDRYARAEVPTPIAPIAVQLIRTLPRESPVEYGVEPIHSVARVPVPRPRPVSTLPPVQYVRIDDPGERPEQADRISSADRQAEASDSLTSKPSIEAPPKREAGRAAAGRRGEPTRGGPPPSLSTPTVRVPSPGTEVVALPGARGDAGFKTGPSPTAVEAPGQPSAAVVASITREDGSDERSVFVDPVEDLRSFMGWQRPEFTDQQPPTDRPGARAAASGGMGKSTPGREYLDVSALRDPLGVYMRRVEDALTERWLQHDLNIADRARGIQGDVTIRYVIESNGRISALEIVRHSGHIELDLLALKAVPTRFPRIPRAVGRDRIHHQVKLRYRNPLVVSSNGVAPP